jgi:hypothetical protein
MLKWLAEKVRQMRSLTPEIGLKQDEDFTINVFDSGIKVLEYAPRRDAA